MLSLQRCCSKLVAARWVNWLCALDKKHRVKAPSLPTQQGIRVWNVLYTHRLSLHVFCRRLSLSAVFVCFSQFSSPALLPPFFFLSVWESDCYLATGVPIYCRWRSFSDSTVNHTRLIRTQQVQIITHKTSLLITLWHGLCVKCSACCLFSPFTNCTCKAAMLLCHQRPYLIGTSCLTRVAETRMSPTCVIYLLYWRTLFSPDAELTDTNLSVRGRNWDFKSVWSTTNVRNQTNAIHVYIFFTAICK